VGLASRRALYRVAGPACRFLLRVAGARVHVSGEFPPGGPFIVMANHSSFVDMFLLPIILKGSYTGVMAEEMMQFPILRPILERLAVVPIVRDDPERAIESLKSAEKALRAGCHVAILPEGTRTTTGEMLPFKSGGFHMALHTRAPVLPVGIAGAFAFKPKNRWTIAPGAVYIRIGRPISADVYERLGTAGLKERVQDEIRRLAAPA
jgi:1-acyl-sn-glycerol-3-phosphate acyltransferase